MIPTDSPTLLNYRAGWAVALLWKLLADQFGRDVDRQIHGEALDFGDRLHLLFVNRPLRFCFERFRLAAALLHQLVPESLHVRLVLPHHLRGLEPGLSDCLLLLREQFLRLRPLPLRGLDRIGDRKSTRLNSSHITIS